MVGQRSPASRWKRFRFLVFLVQASYSRRLIVQQSELAKFVSPFGGESRRSWRAVENLASFASVAVVAGADKSLNIWWFF